MARMTLLTPLHSLPWAKNVHSLPKRSSLPISVLFFLCALPSATSHPVKNDLHVFHLLKRFYHWAASPAERRWIGLGIPNPLQNLSQRQHTSHSSFFSLPTVRSSGQSDKSFATRVADHNQLCVQDQATHPSSVPTSLLGNTPDTLAALYLGAVSTETKIYWVDLGGLVREHEGPESEVKQLKQPRHVY